ncbi:la-related protein 1 [Dorcoceras hygrometricum]|uniref:La-related protein 1 n=1 Tax=Dorcoceras hygrometricum TaxID=472368 RepID=A0A2Z7B012_9LAMI|nr:la-related protein 1 [Dorcoceras hygrometricum]
MRSSIRKIPHPLISRTTTSASIPAALSTSSGGGRGRGGPAPFIFTVDSSAQTESDTPKDESPSSLGQGHGRGRGKPLHSTPTLPSLPSFVNNNAGPAAIGRGRGGGFTPTKSIPPQESKPPQQRPPPHSNAKKPYMLVEEDTRRDSTDSESPVRHEKILPSQIINVLSGAGRGKPTKPEAVHDLKPKTENRHIRPQQPMKPKSSAEEQLTQEEKVKKAVGILSKGDGDSMRASDSIGGGRGQFGPRGGRGRGRGRGRGALFGRGRGRERREDKYEESDNDEPEGLYLGDPADGEKLAEKFGPEVMNQLAEGFEEMSSRVLPSPVDDAYIDALHTNLLIECEPEYLMEEFGTNPDIDEKPPIPLRDALEKMKPFLMAYEGIQSQEEWEEVIEETMKTVPLMKEIVDHYSGPDRVTAKQQQEELERVAKTLPASAPASVKSFTERAVLSLQSNPGWGFDKKCQFMDKLIMEVSRQYK